ncbi:serine protease [Salinispora sp. H7-4]|uniref:trypsin-like serine peptidase n=1 Tax=Salinispora sp. H7-4 TaxID=2748321 RepID=UPI0015D3A377|nr:trypsin-like peptidase domain-containing protein [Salinispora sp. H7-4]NYT94746.1 trypsin-like peptidase domain-containing protein [Salinispora sp. H7-4]
MKSFLRLSVAASLTLALIASGSSGATAGQSATDLAEPVRIGFEVRNGQPVTASGEKVTDYWTPERMAAAVPIAGPASNGTSGERAVASAEGYTLTVGKIFYTLPGGGDSWCSASAVDSPKKRLVLTAAHCVLKESGWVFNIAFVPGYENGEAPLGMFAATNVTVSPSYIHEVPDYGFDLAVLTMANGDVEDRPVGRVVNPFPVEWNTGYEHDNVTPIGYPQNVNGGKIQHHYEEVSTQESPHDNMIWGDFPAYHGASGGPWVRNFNGDGNGTIISINSLADGHGPHLGDELKAVFDWAENFAPE